MTCFKLPSVCKVCILLYILILVTGCNSIPSAVVLAGDNRGEIIKALKYYHNDDPLKHKAVKYLISGMPLHHSYGGSINDFNDALDSLLVMGLSKEDYLSAEKHQYDKFSSSFEICTDLKTIKAEEIIMNVEASFDLWGNGGWADHLDFKEFCKYLLPYKFVELQPLEDWKNQHRGLFSKNLYSVGAECKENNGNPVAAIKAILSELGEIPKSSAEYKSYPIFNPQTILKRPTASCRDFCYAMAGVFLSKGIPVSIDYTPQWGDRKNNHQWMTVLTKRHKNEEFGIDQYAEEYEFLRRRIMPKVYRVSYLPDREMTRRLLLGWTIPVSLGNIFFEDVSDQYLKTDNVKTKLFSRKRLNGNVYAAVFDNTDWIPVAYGKRTVNRKAVFKHLGREILYLPVQIGRNGKQEAIGEPFYIKSNGDIVSFPNNSFSTCSLSFDRKYPIYYKIKKIIPRIGEGIVEISDNASFTGATIICSIPGQHPAISGIVHFDNTVNSRYWRVKATNDTLDIAEIIFKDSLGHILDVSPLNCGKNIVDVKYSGDNFKNGSDNDALTFFSIAGDDIWLGFDLGMNANVKEIMYYKRSDGNDIFPGYNYSLYEWRKNIWVKIKSANSNNGTTLFLEDIPQNTILKLVCDDIGTENRPFAIIDGRVRWF